MARPLPPWERRAAQSHPARPEEAQEPRSGPILRGHFDHAAERPVGAEGHGAFGVVIALVRYVELHARRHILALAVPPGWLNAAKSAKPLAAPSARLQGGTAGVELPQRCSGAQRAAVREREGASSHRWWPALPLPGRRAWPCGRTRECARRARRTSRAGATTVHRARSRPARSHSYPPRGRARAAAWVCRRPRHRRCLGRA